MPLGQGSGSVLFESVAAVEMALMVEVVVDRGMNSAKFLQRLDVPEPCHCCFAPSKRLMRVLGSMVKPAPAFLPSRISKRLHRSLIRSQPVGND